MLIDKLINNDMILGPLILLVFVILGLILCGLTYILKDVRRINIDLSIAIDSIKALKNKFTTHRRKPMGNHDTVTALVTSSGIGFTGLLTIVFIILKLIHIIKWSWWWVLSPLWISAGLVIGILIIVGIVIGIILFANRRK